MGIKYEKIKVSAFRLSLSIRQLELRPSESELAKTFVVAIIPSADVTSPPLGIKGEGREHDHWGDKIADKLQHTKTRKGHRRRDSDRGSSSSDPAPDPFRGSNLRIQEVGMGCSFHLVKVLPLVSLVRRWREYKELQKVIRSETSSSGAGSQDKLERGEQMEERAKTIGKQKKPEETWLRFLTFYFPAPHIRIRVKGVSVQVDKAYLAPEPPEGFIPTHRHQRSISFFGDDTLNFEEDNSVATDDEVLPSAIVPKNAAKNSKVMPKDLPVFADQDTMLQYFAGESRSEADSIIFHMERWVEHTIKKHGVNDSNKRKSKSLKEDGRAKSKQPEARARGGKADGTNGRRSPDFQGEDEKIADEGSHDDIMNFLLKSILRRVLSSVEVECADISLTIAGADAPTVKNARKTNEVEPYRANLFLSRLGWHQRAVTVLSIESVFVSFQGPECTLKVGIGGISMQVGMPAQRKILSDVGPSPPSSPGRRGVSNIPNTGGTKAGERRKRRRTWYTIIPSDNDIVADVTGVLPILVWALNYDHFWQKRMIGINVRMSNLSLRLESTALYTALVHLDDFADPDSSHGEWATWLRRKYQGSISPLSDIERQIYRDCYRKAKGIKEVVQKKRGDRGILLKKQKPSYLNVSQNEADSPGTTPVKDSSEAGSLSSKVQKTRPDTTKKSDGLEKETLAKLETRMKRDEILKERCTVLRDKWNLSASNPELQEFLALTKSELQSRKKSPRIIPEAVPQSDEVARGDTVDQGIQLSPFEKSYASPVDVLVCLVQEKFHLLAPSVDILADIGAIQLHFIDRLFGERAAKLMGSSSSTMSSQGVMSTTLLVKDTCIEIYQQNIVFSASSEGASPRVFQNISMAVDSIVWRPDVTAVGNVQLPTFVDESPCGIVYKQLDNTNLMGDTTTNSMVSLILEHKKDPTESSDSHLTVNLLAGNLVFVMNPIPLASSLAVLMSFADLPFRDLASEKEAQEVAELEKSGDGIASFRQSTLYTFSTSVKPEEDTPPPPVGIVLGGANMLLAVQLSHITVIPLPDATGVNRGTVEATIQDISLLAESSIDGVESAEMTVAPFQVLSCRLFYVPSDQGGFVKPFHLPFKPALEFGGASIIYASRPKEPIVVPVSSPKAAVGDGLEERHVFDVSLTAYVRRAVAYLSPTINASLLGALNCSGLILEYLPTPEQPATDPTKSTSGQEDDRSRREALKELWRMADRNGSGTLSVEEVSEIIARLFSAKAQNIFDEIPKSQQLTDMELKREVQYFLSLAGSNSTATRDLSFPEVEFLLFQKRRLQESGMTASEHAAQSHDFGSIEGLRGLIYYEDLLEYSSSTQVYALTGTLHTSKFPPPSSWRQGEGIKLFWELYERETGCTKESLNDQVGPLFRRELWLNCSHGMILFLTHLQFFSCPHSCPAEPLTSQNRDYLMSRESSVSKVGNDIICLFNGLMQRCKPSYPKHSLQATHIALLFNSLFSWNNVSRKIADIVRILLNYNFAKYCWKTLVKPALLQSQQEEFANTPTTPRRVARKTTDWVIDKNTKTKFRTGALDLFASHVKKLETDIDNVRGGSSSDEATANVVYDLRVVLEMDEASAKIGNGLTFAT